jgi:peptidyl-tRNA hydrolase ICT1
VNSKATLKVPLDQLLAILPTVLHSGIRASPHYARKSDSLVIQAEDSRKQGDNTHACFARLYSLVRDTAAQVIPGETSNAQREHVQKL